MAQTEADRRRLAVALAYREGQGAPKVVAKGRGLLADAIIERAREAGVYVHESEVLVSLLLQVDLDRHIPPTLYVAVAELLAWIYQVEKRQVSRADAQGGPAAAPAASGAGRRGQGGGT